MADNALIEFQTYLSFLGEEPADTGLVEERVQLFINAASQLIENYCDRKFIATTSQDEIFDGDGESDYIVSNLPLTGTPTLYYWNGSQWVEATAANYPRATDSASGRIWFTQRNTFWKGSDNWKVSYDFGYAIAAVPGDLQAACCVLIQRAMIKAEKKEGLASESFEGITTTVSLSRMPEDVKLILNLYRRLSFG